MDNFYDNEKKPSATSNLVYIGVSALVLFGVVYLVGRAWKKSQTAQITMFLVPNPKYKFKEDFTAKLCSNFIKSFTTKKPCKSYEDLVFIKGNVF